MESEETGGFYDKGKAYWEKIPATVDGMLGGFTRVSSPDIQGSSRFLKKFFTNKKQPLGSKRALDCGAGIGRITKHLLLRHFETVDLVEQNPVFINTVKEYVGNDASKIGNLFCYGLQDFVPETKTYDVIWCQWVTGHLTNSDFVSFLKRCKLGLKENGLIVIKDNLTSSTEVDNDHEDSSVTRPKHVFLQVFKDAGLIVVDQRKQTGFPKLLYEVRMFALR